jgi:hypothetical protein
MSSGDERILFTESDRRRQLSDLAAVCDQLHRDILTDLRRDFGVMASLARDLLARGFDQVDLTELSGQFPTLPDWMNPKALDAGLPLEPWQAGLTELIQKAWSLALDLRTLATLAATWIHTVGRKHLRRGLPASLRRLRRADVATGTG